MGKGRYLKAAERACARKARFETHAAAEAFVERRYRAYRCVVCGGYHLTSGRGDRPPTPDTPKREPPGPKLGDLDWSAVLRTPDCPTPTPSPSPDDGGSSSETLPRGDEEGGRTARCVGPCGKDGRVLLVLAGRLLKSRPVDQALRGSLTEGVLVEIEGEPPTVVRIRPKG